MCSTKGNNEGKPNRSAIPKKFQDELIYAIHTSVNNISTQISNLNKLGEDLFGKLSKEVDRADLRLKPLQQRVVQLTDAVLAKIQNERLALRTIEPQKTLGNETLETEQVYTSKPLPAKKCETQDASVQTSLLNISAPYYLDDTESLNIPPDIYCFELCEEKITFERKDQKWGKLKQKKCIGHPSDLEQGPQHQLMEVDMSLGHLPNASEALRSYMDQSAASSSSNIPFREISKILTRAVGRVLTSPPRLPKHGAGDLKNSCTYVNYGTGMGEELQPQPRPRPKTEVFVSPLAPTSPPPLPPDWLSALRASKRENTAPSQHFQNQVSLPAWRTPAATSVPEYPQTPPQSSRPITPPQFDFYPGVHKTFQYCKVIPDDLYSQGDEQEIPPPLPPTETSIQLKDTVTDIVDSTSVVHPQEHSVFHPSKSSFIQPPRSYTAKPPKPSIPSTTRFSRPPPPRISVTILPRSSIQQTSQSSSPQSLLSSYPRPTQFSSPRYSVAHVPRCSLASSPKRLDAQASKYPFAQSSRPSFAQSTSSPGQAQRPSLGQSTGNWNPPQPTSSFKSPKSSTLQTLFSFAQSPPSCYSRPQDFSVPESSSVPVSPGLKNLNQAH